MNIAGSQSLLRAQITSNSQVIQSSMKSADASRERQTRARREKADAEKAAAANDVKSANIKAGVAIGAAVLSAASNLLTLGASGAASTVLVVGDSIRITTESLKMLAHTLSFVSQAGNAAVQLGDAALKGDAAEHRYEAALYDQEANSQQSMVDRAQDRMRTAEAQSKEHADFILQQMVMNQQSSRWA